MNFTIKKNHWLLLLTAAIILFSCNKTEKAEEKISTKSYLVFVSNYPLYYFTSRISGNKVELLSPNFNEQDPVSWKPSAEIVAKIQNADLIIFNGAGYESWSDNYSLPNSRILDTSKSFEKSLIKTEETVTHSHGSEGEHVHHKSAYTTWLDFSLASQQALAIKEALLQISPENKDFFEKNYAKLKTDLDGLDKQMSLLSKQMEGTTFLFSHPVYQYLKSAYGFKGHSFHWEPDQSISPEMDHDLTHVLEKQNASYFIWESEPLEENVEKLNKKDILSVVFNPCNISPKDGDFIEKIQENINNVKAINDK